MKTLLLPLTRNVLQSLRAGDEVSLTGIIYTARDAAHKRIAELISEGKEVPISLEGACIFYAGPTPPKKDATTCAIGPTTATRMDPFTPLLFEQGMIACIGKGKRAKYVRDALIAHGGIYFVAIGGIAAYLSRCIESIKPVAFHDLGAEAVYELYVKDFPCIVGIDSQGNDIYESTLIDT